MKLNRKKSYTRGEENYLILSSLMTGRRAFNREGGAKVTKNVLKMRDRGFLKLERCGFSKTQVTIGCITDKGVREHARLERSRMKVKRLYWPSELYAKPVPMHPENLKDFRTPRVRKIRQVPLGYIE